MSQLTKSVRQCLCANCRRYPRSVLARDHRTINRLLAIANERMRRLLAGFYARQLGHGGIVEVERITGIDRNTIAKGMREVSRGRLPFPGRIRRPGGGRKAADASGIDSCSR